MNKLLNEVIVMFYKWIELNIVIKEEDLTNMFSMLLSGDKRYIRYCPESIEKDIFAFEKMILRTTKKQREEILLFIKHAIVCYKFDSLIKKETSVNNDILYYKSVNSNYYITNLLNGTLDMNKIKQFQRELYELGKLINKFYSCSNDDKQTIKSMVKSKTSDIFKRYNFNYSYPICTN